jgi:peptidoglycan/xylan/chitin deacetylase (PgdA/CDA1 family)
MVIRKDIIMSYNQRTGAYDGISNVIKLGILLIILTVATGGIVITLQPTENVPLNGDQDNSGEQVVFSEGELVEDFENIPDWRADGVGVSQEADTSNVIHGNQSLKLTGTGGNIAFTTKTTSLDLSDATNIIFWVYVHNKTALNAISLYISPTADWTSYFVRRVPAYTLVNSWNNIAIIKPQFSVVGEASWDSPTVLLRVRVRPNEGMNASVSFDDCRHSYKARARAIITFDDGWSNILNTKPIMDKNEQTGTLFAIAGAGTGFTIAGYEGAGNYLTLSELQLLYEAGWDISNHGYNHLDLTSLSLEELHYEVNAAYDWLVANGFVRSAHLFAYPFGGYNDTVIDVVREHHSLGRTLVYGTYQPHLSNVDSNIQYKLKTFIILNTTSVQDIKDRIDSAIQQNGLLILTFHQIVDENAIHETQYLTSQFEEISDYLKSKEADIDVITLSSLYESYNKTANN